MQPAAVKQGQLSAQSASESTSNAPWSDMAAEPSRHSSAVLDWEAEAEEGWHGLLEKCDTASSEE